MIHEFMNTHLYISNSQTKKKKINCNEPDILDASTNNLAQSFIKKLSLNIKDHNPQKNQTIVPYHSIQYEFYIYVLVNYNLVNYTHKRARFTFRLLNINYRQLFAVFVSPFNN